MNAGASGILINMYERESAGAEATRPASRSLLSLIRRQRVPLYFILFHFFPTSRLQRCRTASCQCGEPSLQQVQLQRQSPIQLGNFYRILEMLETVPGCSLLVVVFPSLISSNHPCLQGAFCRQTLSMTGCLADWQTGSVRTAIHPTCGSPLSFLNGSREAASHRIVLPQLGGDICRAREKKKTNRWNRINITTRQKDS